MRCHCNTIYRPCARCHRLFPIPEARERHRGKPQRYCSRACIYADEADRFWSNIQKGDGCWLWTAKSRHPFGYGLFQRKNGKQSTASRVAWELTHGEIPEGMGVCHSCDQPACCNPSHMFLGTLADNNHDTIAKGRSARARLQEWQVRAIRDRYAAGTSQSDLADAYHVSTWTISQIVNRHTWKHVE
jgi:hypothetical protein